MVAPPTAFTQGATMRTVTSVFVPLGADANGVGIGSSYLYN
jgi:hypothetical protein